MLLLQANNIKKSFGDRTIFESDEFKVYSGDRIGIVGLNGSGKTTLLEVLSGNMEPDEGTIRLFSEISYIKQFGGNSGGANGLEKKEFGVKDVSLQGMSGGEKTRLKIASELSKNCRLLFADEPTTNLDTEGIKLVEDKLQKYKGAVLLISHDRELLDKVCDSIVEIHDGKLRFYKGNYSSYKESKKQAVERQHFEYEQYVSEKKRLEDNLRERTIKIDGIRKAPKRMGNSEARLHKRESTEVQKKLAGYANALKTRIEKLEVKEKPKDDPRIVIEASRMNQPVSRIIASGNGISQSFGKRNIFENIAFEIPSGSKTALLGNNGSGKTTLIKLMIGGGEGIRIANGVKIGYFSQSLDIIKPNSTVLENVMEVSAQKEWAARTVLARLLFKREEVFKKAGVLSGGEKVKLSIAMLILSEANFLVMDEPTNYLDLMSMEALQSLIKEYPGTVLFVSHDRRFASEVADRILLLQDKKLLTFEDGYEDYLKFLNKRDKEEDEPAQNEMILRMRLAELAAKLSVPGKCSNFEELDREYNEIAIKLRRGTVLKNTTK